MIPQRMKFHKEEFQQSKNTLLGPEKSQLHE